MEKSSPGLLIVLFIALFIAMGSGWYLNEREVPRVDPELIPSSPDPETSTTNASSSDPITEAGAIIISFVDDFVSADIDGIVQRIPLTSDAIDARSTLGGEVEVYIDDMDVNFDGYPDLGVFESTGYMGVNNYYTFYTFNPTTRSFAKDSSLPAISNPTLDPDTKTVISTYKSGPMTYTTTYTLEADGTYFESDELPVTE